MTARVSFRQDDVTRAVRGAASAGLQVSRVEVSPIDGKIVIIAENQAATRSKRNPWDGEFEET